MATMSQMELLTRRAVATGSNIMFLSPPGRGKTAQGDKISAKLQAEDPSFEVIDFDCGTLAPTDLVMAMPNMVDKIIQTLRDSRLPNYHAAGGEKRHGMMNLHEWMLAGLEVNRGLQKLVNKEELGGFRIPPGFIFRADGNRLQDRSGAQQQSRALMSRFDVFELEYDSEYALQVAKDHYHERVAAFLIRNPTYIDNYGDVFESTGRSQGDVTLQEGKRGAWANLRSWDRVSRKLRHADATGHGVMPEEVSASVGSGVAGFFDAFGRMLDNLSTIEDIIKDPKGVVLPTRSDECYALATMLALTVNKGNFKPVFTYMQRYNVEFQAAFFRLMNDRLAKAKDANTTAIRASKDYKDWITSKHITAILHGASAA